MATTGSVITSLRSPNSENASQSSSYAGRRMKDRRRSRPRCVTSVVTERLPAPASKSYRRFPTPRRTHHAHTNLKNTDRVRRPATSSPTHGTIRFARQCAGGSALVGVVVADPGGVGTAGVGAGGGVCGAAGVGTDRRGWTARLWRVAEATEHAVLSGHTGGVWGCAFSPDGTLLPTTSDDRTVRLWHVATGIQATVLAGHGDWVTSCAFSPDGTLLATTSRDHTARLWRILDGTTHTVLTGHTGKLSGC